MRVVLPSNSSLKHFPNNTLTSYTVQLPQTIDLSVGQWEVGLEEIQFYKSWLNVRDCSITITRDGKDAVIRLDDGYYNTNADLIEAMNKKIQSNATVKNLIEFYYSNPTQS